MRLPSKKLIIILVFLCVILGMGRYFSPARFEHDSLYIQSNTRLWPIEIEIAETEKQKKKGLMNRRRLKESTGMLFVSSEPQIMHMWMKNTLIPLDMLFIDHRGIIVYIAPNVRPKSLGVITFNTPVKAVLELPGGTAKTLMIKPGDFVIHSLFDISGPP